MDILDIFKDYSIYIILGLIAFNFILFIISIVALCKASNLKKRINKFLRPQSEQHNIEAMLIDYLGQVKKMNDQHAFLLNNIESINNRLHFCIQKAALIRYNPFEEVGGDLSFALALLNQDNNGLVLNSIYSRESSYTYAKPIVNGKCEKYNLSSEEEQAVKRAMDSLR